MQAQLRAQQASKLPDFVRHPLIEALPQGLAGFRMSTDRMQVNLLAQGGNAETRDTSGLAQREQFLEQVVATIRLPLQHRQARRRQVAEHDRVRRRQPRQHIQAVGQYGTGLLRGIALQQYGGQPSRQDHGHRAAPADILIGAGQAETQRVLGGDHLAFPPIGDADDPLAEATNGIQLGSPLEQRRTLAVMTRLFRLPLAQRDARVLVGEDCLQLYRTDWRPLQPGRDDLPGLIRTVGEIGRSRGNGRRLAAFPR
ncbi:hypothetical protein D9M68_674150 [compost metagenome]